MKQKPCCRHQWRPMAAFGKESWTEMQDSGTALGGGIAGWGREVEMEKAWMVEEVIWMEEAAPWGRKLKKDKTGFSVGSGGIAISIGVTQPSTEYQGHLEGALGGNHFWSCGSYCVCSKAQLWWLANFTSFLSPFRIFPDCSSENVWTEFSEATATSAYPLDWLLALFSAPQHHKYILVNF